MIFRAICYIFFSFPFIALARAISRQLEKYIPYCPHNHTLTSTYYKINSLQLKLKIKNLIKMYIYLQS